MRDYLYGSCFWKLVLITSFLFISFTISSQDRQSDSLQLVIFYDSLNGEGWVSSENWLTGPLDTWQGIKVLNDRVSEIYFYSNDLAGDLPNLELSELKRLDLRVGDITSIPNFIGTPNIEYIAFVNNKITSIPNFANLDNLYFLDLKSNNISVVPNFTQLPVLRSLSLTGNKITELPDFTDLDSLEYLDCSFNDLSEIVDFSELPNLRTLYIAHNELDSIPDFTNLPHLTRLAIGDNNLESIPNFSNLSNLLELYIEENLIVSLPTLSNLTSLELLYLINNNLMTINNLNLPNLRTLEANSNDIEIVSNLNLPLLEELKLVDNRVSRMINLSLPNVLEINLSYNELENLQDFQNFTNLRSLVLYENNIEEISNLENLTELVSLDIGSNDLNSIPDLSANGNLQSLNLYENNVSSIPNLQNYLNLNSLNISHNQFDTIQDLANLSNLQYLSLSGNNFTSLPILGSNVSPFFYSVDSNKLTFEDVLDVFAFEFLYYDQDSIYYDTTITLLQGDDYSINLGIDENVNSNQYIWFKDGLSYDTTNLNHLDFTNIQPTDAGVYTVQVTNPQAPQLTLYSREITLQIFIANQPPTAQKDTSSIFINEVSNINVAANDFDPDGNLDKSSIVIVTPPQFGNVSILQNGFIKYTHTGNSPGMETFEYAIYDSGAPALGDTATIEITIFEEEADLVLQEFILLPFEVGGEDSLSQEEADALFQLLIDTLIELGAENTYNCPCDTSKGQLWNIPNGLFDDSTGELTLLLIDLVRSKSKTVVVFNENDKRSNAVFSEQDSLYANTYIYEQEWDASIPSIEDQTNVVKIAVIGSGADTSNDLIREYLAPPDDPNCSSGYQYNQYGLSVILADSLPGNLSPQRDILVHETYVTGNIILNSEMSEAHLKPLIYKTGFNKHSSGKGKPNIFRTACSIYLAVDAGVKVINISGGWLGKKNEFFEKALQYAKDRDVLLVVSAGNQGTDLDKFIGSNSGYFPASYAQEYDNVFVVGAIEYDSMYSDFSSGGDSSVHCASYGRNVVSPSPTNRFTPVSGTSIAVPQVTAAFARIFHIDSTLTYSQAINEFFNNYTSTDSILNDDVINGKFLNIVNRNSCLDVPESFAAVSDSYNMFDTTKNTFDILQNDIGVDNNVFEVTIETEVVYGTLEKIGSGNSTKIVYTVTSTDLDTSSIEYFTYSLLSSTGYCSENSVIIDLYKNYDDIDTTTTTNIFNHVLGEENLLNVYPNPFNSEINLQYTIIDSDANTSIKLNNVTDQLMFDLLPIQKINKGTYTKAFSLAELPFGVYFVTISNGKYYQTIKVIRNY